MDGSVGAFERRASSWRRKARPETQAGRKIRKQIFHLEGSICLLKGKATFVEVGTAYIHILQAIAIDIRDRHGRPVLGQFMGQHGLYIEIYIIRLRMYEIYAQILRNF